MKRGHGRGSVSLLGETGASSKEKRYSFRNE